MHAIITRAFKGCARPRVERYQVIDFGSDSGQREPAVSSGGLSTLPWTLEGKIQRLENKTLRYSGHWQQMIAFRQLGLFREDKLKIEDVEICF